MPKSPVKDLKKLSKDLQDLTKFKLSLLNSIGAYSMFYFYAPLGGVGLMNSALFMFATQTVAMSSQCFGQIAESGNDALMNRTKHRPMVLKKFTGQQGCFIGSALSVASILAYSQFVPFTFLISNAVWFSYLCVYLPMKQKTSYNTVAGAVVGALPPFIGTFAQTGAIFDIPTLILASYIFSWQFPHFYGILYENKDDYKKAGFVMISDEDPKGQNKAYKQMMYCNIFNSLLPIAMALPQVGMIHPAFLVPFFYYQAINFQAIFNFKKEEASTGSAKQIKKTAYMPFVILLAAFFGTTGWNRYQERRIRDEEQWKGTVTLV